MATTAILQMTDPVMVPSIVMGIFLLGLIFLFGSGYYILANTSEKILNMEKGEYYDMYLAYREEEVGE